MKLTELEPVWIPLGGASRTHGGFTFKCPCCRKVWLICKLIYADLDEQEMVMEGRGVTPPNFVPAREHEIWNIEGDFPDLNVSPSIDASASGHWHGRIENGVCR